MPEYIDREVALSELNKICEYFDSEDTRYGVTFSMDEIRQLPSVDVNPVLHGRWVMISNNPWDGAKCSECGRYYSGSEWGDRYCKVCGAKMDSE